MKLSLSNTEWPALLLARSVAVWDLVEMTALVVVAMGE